MNWPSFNDFREVRRALPIIAAVLFVTALFFPMWVIEVHAVQYPSTTLYVKVFAYPHLAGDYHEMYMLNKYVGFHYPDPVFWDPNYKVREGAVNVPEWSLGPVAFVVVSALSLFVAIAPTVEKLKKGITGQLIGTILVFGIMLVDIQYRLYQMGHSLDPDAPVMGVKGFTPPLIGRYEVANITSYSYFGTGAGIAILAIVLLVVAFYYRNKAVTFGDLPYRFLSRIGLKRKKEDSQSDALSDDIKGDSTKSNK
ncbi:MAG: hypothetical protein ABEI06_10495 [Halobacteriaceae archaeon]